MNEKLIIEKKAKPYIEFAVTDRFIVFALLFFAVLIRLFMLTEIPYGIEQDESLVALNSKYLLEYGHDMNGLEWPVLFQSWGYSQMSVLASYFMIPFIKIFGFNLWAVRLPSVMISTFGLIALYFTGRKLFNNERVAQILLLFGAVNPWHYIQSRWTLEADFYPHLFLIAFCLMLYGLEKGKSWKLYLSMVIFGLTLYSYSVAVYITPMFLLAYFGYLVLSKSIKFRKALLCAGIFTLIGLPFILCMFINAFGFDTIKLPFMTIPYLSGNSRKYDIIFFRNENVGYYILMNMAHLLTIYVIGDLSFIDGNYFMNVLPVFFLPFLIVGLFSMISRYGKENSKFVSKPAFWALMMWIIVANLSGIITCDVNISRINILPYTMIITTVYGMWITVERFHKVRWGVVVYAVVVSLAFFPLYFESHYDKASRFFDGDYGEALTYAREEYSDKAYSIEARSVCDGYEQYTLTESFTWYYINIEYDYLHGNVKDDAGFYYKDRYEFLQAQKYFTGEFVTQYDVTEDPEKCYILLTNNHQDDVFPEGYEVTQFGKYLVVCKTAEGGRL